MPLALDLTRQAIDFVDRLQPKQQRQIGERLTQLANDPNSLPTEQLKGYAPWRRLKSGEFRIVYEVDGNTLKIHLIGKRNDDDIYRALQRIWKN
jgi:mRNA interferase RelE/StbE